MRYHPLQEIAKLAAGLIAADFMWLIWFAQSNLRSTTFFGTSVSQDMLLPAMLFDVAVVLILIHYGWNIGRIPQMRERSYMLAVGTVFSIVAVAHLFRIFANGDLNLMGWDVPVWLSWFGVAVATYLAYTSFHMLSKAPRKGRN